jgi:hypothetical protein
MPRVLRHAPLLAAALLAGCMNLTYSLDGLPFPVSASPLRSANAPGDRFVLGDKYVKWVFGLFGDSKPDVQGVLLEHLLPCSGIADFRVTSSASFPDWLVTHLTLGLVQMQTVTVTGVRIRTGR